MRGGEKEDKGDKDLVERIRDRNRRNKDMTVVLNTGPIDVHVSTSKAVEMTCTTCSDLPTTYEGQDAKCRYFVSLKRKGESSFEHRQIFRHNTTSLFKTSNDFRDDPILSKLKLVETHTIEEKRDVEKRFNLKRQDGILLAKLSFRRDNYDGSYVSGVIVLQENTETDEESYVQLDALRTETIVHSGNVKTEVIQSLVLETSRALVLPFRLSYGERRSVSRPVETNMYVSAWSLRLRFSTASCKMLEWTFPISDVVEKEDVFERKSEVKVCSCASVSLEGKTWDDHLLF